MSVCNISNRESTAISRFPKALAPEDEDISALIAESMEELRTIEESQEELARQLEANVEVELLLRR